MSSTTYDIVTRLSLDDKMTSGAAKITGATSSLQKSLLGTVTLGNVFGNMITKSFSTATRAIERAAESIKNLNKEMIGLNQQFEDQKLGLAAIINGNLQFSEKNGQNASPQRNLMISVGMSERQMKQFEEAAKTAPGSAKDFSNIAQYAADPYFKAGGKLGQDFTDLIKKTLIAGSFTGQANDVTALDVQQVLQGSARGIDRLPKLLGLDIEALNKASPAERLKKLKEGLDNFISPESADMLKNSFTTIKATFGDLIDIAKRTAGIKLFDGIKSAMRSLNDFMETNQRLLVVGFEVIIDAISAFAKMVFAPFIAYFRYLNSGTEASKKSISAIIDSLKNLSNAFVDFSKAMGVETGNMDGYGQTVTFIFKAIADAMANFIDRMTTATLFLKLQFEILTNSIFDLGLAVSQAMRGDAWGTSQTITKIAHDNKSGINSTYEQLASVITRNKVDKSMFAASSYLAQSKAFQDYAAKSKNPENNNYFSGDININQDFKENADPDRVAFQVKEVFDKLKSRPRDSAKRFAF